MWRDLAQPSHLLILAVIIAVLFGWKKLPDAARSVGRSMRIFKSEMSEMKNDGTETKPSPAAKDTVPGVVPQPSTPTDAAAAQTAAAQTAAAQTAAAPQATQPPTVPPVVAQPQSAAPPTEPHDAEQARHNNPAL